MEARRTRRSTEGGAKEDSAVGREVLGSDGHGEAVEGGGRW